MFRPRWSKVLADLWSNKVRSLLVIASIAIGLFAVGMIASMNLILMQDMQTSYGAIHPANILINSSLFTSDLVDNIRHKPGVAQAQGESTFSLRVQTEPGAWSPIDFKAIPNIGEAGVNQLHLLSGSFPADHELVVDQYKFPDLNAKVGDMLTVELPSGKTRLIRLAGMISDQTIGATGGGGFFIAPLQAYVPLTTADWLEQPKDQMNQLMVTTQNGQNDLTHLRQVANQLTKDVENSGRTVYSSSVRSSNDHPNRVYVQAITSVLYFLGLLVVFLSAFLITNTLSALLNQQVQQIGVMKTLGATRNQIMVIYMVLIFVFGMIAFFIAVPLAAQASNLLLQYLASRINMRLLGFRYVPLAIAMQLAIALIVPQAAAFIPILRGTSVSAVEAFSGYTQSKPPARRGWLDNLLKKFKRLSRAQILSLRNTFRNKGRLALTLITLTLGGAIFISTFNVQGSLSAYISRVGKYFMADVNLAMDRDYRINEVEKALKEIPGVGHIEAWAAARGEIVMPDGKAGDSVSILGPPVDSPLVNPIMLEGRWVVPGDQNAIVLGERFRQLFPNIKIGDTLRMKVNGESDKRSFVVVGFFQLAGNASGYLAYTTFDYLSELTHMNNRSVAFRIMSDRPNLTYAEQKALGEKIYAALKDKGYSISEVDEGNSLTQKTAGGLSMLTAFLLIMASLIAIVGSIGLTGTMSMNVMERTREIGVLRAIGASDGAVLSLVIVEGVLIGFISWVFGTLLAFPISLLLNNAITMALFGAPSAFTFTPTGVVVWLVVVMVLSVLASVMPARNAARLTIREVLAYE